MSRFFVPPDAVKGKLIIISGKEAHHILDVMRLKIQDKVITFDGTGKEYLGFILEISRNSLTVKVNEVRAHSQKYLSNITLLQALPKKEKMDYIVEKSTELGVSSIVPMITGRTIPDWNEEKMRAQAERWRKIAREAAKQCGRLDIPAVSDVVKFTNAVRDSGDFDASTALSIDPEQSRRVDMRLIAILSEETMPVRQAISGFKSGRIVIAIGPEGDFTADEASTARESGFKAISLGPRVLKSDTAGLALISILNYELSN